MTAFLPQLREAETDLPEDPIRDELCALRQPIREVSLRLAEARIEQDRLLSSAARTEVMRHPPPPFGFEGFRRYSAAP